jgi:hypothetical protein
VATQEGHLDALARHARFVITPQIGHHVFEAMDKGSENRLEAISPIQRDIVAYGVEFGRMVAAFALMNMREFVEAKAVASSGRRAVGSRFLPALSHHVLGLTSPRRIVTRRVVHAMAQAAQRKRRHEVGGFFRTITEGDGACDGAWDHAFLNETSIRRRCVTCGLRQSWVHDHERGDASVGYVTKDYKVKG